MHELHVMVIVSQVPVFVCKQLRKTVTVPLKLLLPLLFPVLNSVPYLLTHSIHLLCHFLSLTASATRIHDLAWRPAIESGPKGNVLFPSLLLHLSV